MTIITIPLVQGPNYISFPATSSDNFDTIFTGSGIINNIPENQFTKLNHLTQMMEPVNYNEYIQKGIGYKLYVNSPANIIYDGTEFTMTFDELASIILPGWNLIGTGSNTIIPLNWCKTFDPYYNVVTHLYPMNAYWIYYDFCKPSPGIGSSAFTAIAALGTVLFTYYLLREFSIIGKPVETTYEKS